MQKSKVKTALKIETAAMQRTAMISFLDRCLEDATGRRRTQLLKSRRDHQAALEALRAEAIALDL